MNRLMIVAAAALFALGLTGCGDKDAKPAAQDTTVTSTAPAPAPMEEKTAPAAAPEAQQPAADQQPATEQQPAADQQPAAEGQENH